VVEALNADWLKAYTMGMIKHVFLLLYVGNHFIIAIRHIGGLWYMANIPPPMLYCLSIHSVYKVHPSSTRSDPLSLQNSLISLRHGFYKSKTFHSDVCPC
jgi:hypothetical protein